MLQLDFVNILILLILFGIIALSLVVANFFMYRTIVDTQNRENAARTWPKVTGEIVTSETRYHRHEGHPSAAFPHVSYSYEVNGKTYHSSNIMAGGDLGGLNVESTLARYPHDAKVTVYYDPHSPKDAVLEPGNKTFSKALWLMLAVMNIFICVIGVVGVYDTLK